MTDLREDATRYKLSLQVAVSIWDAACGPYMGSDGFHFAPQKVIDRYESFSGRRMLREEVPDWMAFENTNVEWDHADFAKIMHFEAVAPDTDILLITDEGLLDGSAFGFVKSEFNAFAEWYEAAYGMEFFQPADYIAFDRALHYVSVLHHEGIVFRSRIRPGVLA